MADANGERVAIDSEDSIVAARLRARNVARTLGFGMLDQSRIATAVSELTRNVVRYAINGQGEMLVRPLPGSERGSVGLEIVVRDDGPGIPDIAHAMRDGFTSGHGMGMGLSGTKRLMDEMEILSAQGQGTTVTIRKWRR
jgi:serine/threonine-protein kinase RsbT